MMECERHETLRHEHVFLGPEHDRNGRRTRLVLVISAVAMAVELAAGVAFGSVALIAEGVHMAAHVGVLAAAAFAYAFARRNARTARFTFGTGKVGDLAGFASAVALGLTAVLLAVESAPRLWRPVPIDFDAALPVAVLGVAVSLLSAWLLGAGERTAAPGRHDHNLGAVLAHLVADVWVGALAILGLVLGRRFGWVWLDPLTGLVAAAVVGRYALRLFSATAAVLVDAGDDEGLAAAVRAKLETGGDRLVDLHVWRLGPGHYAAIVSLVSAQPRPPADYKARLADLPGLSHLTVEVAPAAEVGVTRPRAASPAELLPADPAGAD